MTNVIKDIYLVYKEKQNRKDFFTSGYQDLDIFCKYLEEGNIITIGGRPSMGKTSLALSIVNHLIEKDKNILYFTMSESKERIVKRLLADKLGYSLSKFDDKMMDCEINLLLETYANKKIEIVDKSSLVIEEFEEKIQELKPEIVFVDYVQLLKMPKAPNLTEATNLIIHEIKKIAVENNVIVVLLSQLSRSVEARCDKRPLLSDLRNGSLLEEISDIVLMIYRDDYYNLEEEERCIAEMIVVKNSLGNTGTISLKFKNGYFRNIEANIF